MRKERCLTEPDVCIQKAVCMQRLCTEMQFWCRKNDAVGEVSKNVFCRPYPERREDCNSLLLLIHYSKEIQGSPNSKEQHCLFIVFQSVEQSPVWIYMCSAFESQFRV